MLSFSEVPQIRAKVQLPTADDIITHFENGNTVKDGYKHQKIVHSLCI